MTWPDTWQYVITWQTSHDVKARLPKHKIDIWLLLYVDVSELERWFYFRFARYLGREIHSNYRRLGDLHACIHAWPWNWRSRHGLRDLCYRCLYCFFSCFVRILGQEIHSNYRRLRGLHAWSWNWMSRHGLRDICHFWLYLCYRNYLFCFVKFLGQGIHSNYCN